MHRSNEKIRTVHKKYTFQIFLSQGAETSCVCVFTKRVCVKFTEPNVYTVLISAFVQSRRVHLFIVNCVLKNKFYIHVVYYLYI